MKNNYQRLLVKSAALSVALAGSAAYAGPVEMTVPPAPMETADVVTGSLKLDFYSHFISYGNDVWSDGDDAFTWGSIPPLNWHVALPADFTFTLGAGRKSMKNSNGR